MITNNKLDPHMTPANAVKRSIERKFWSPARQFPAQKFEGKPLQQPEIKILTQGALASDWKMNKR